MTSPGDGTDRYRRIVEGLADGLVLLDDDHTVVFANDGFAQMLGHTAPSDVLGRPFEELVGEADSERVGRNLKRWRNGEVTRFEASLVGATRNVPVLLSGRSLQSEGDEPQRLLIVATDFAERHALSEKLALARKMEGLSSLAGGIAHDFNNLLTGILGNASRIRLTTIDLEIDELARAVEDSAELAARLTQRLLALVRGQAPHRRLLDISDLVSHTVGLVARVLPDSVELHTFFEPGLSPVLADESQLQQAVLNMCINARDAMMEQGTGGTLSIAVRSGTLTKPLDDGTFTDEPAIELEVSDSGPGVPPELRDRIFDPFFTTKGLGRGIGLGLATVYQLVDAHGGTVEVGKSAAGGARFTLRLPVHAGRGLPATRPSRTSSVDQPSVPSGVVLLAEDEEAVRQLVSASLRAQGYEVLAAADGPSAVELWSRNRSRIDLLFLDVRMPGLEGPDVLRIARKDRPEVPAVFSSGFIPDDPSAQEVFERVMYLPKPYRVPDLIATVRAAIRRFRDGGGTTSTTPVPAVTTLEEEAIGVLGFVGRADAGETLVDQPPLSSEEFGPVTTIRRTIDEDETS